MALINTRSPFYIKVTASTGTITTVDFDIRIWEGHYTTDVPASATYSISKTPLTDTYCVIEISELIRDYYDVRYGVQKTDALWVKVAYTINRTGGTDTGNTTYLALDGYGYYAEGVNPRTSAGYYLLQTNYSIIYFVAGRDIHIPFYSDDDVIVAGSEFPAATTYDIVTDYWDALASAQAGNIADYVNASSESGEQIVYLVMTNTENLTETSHTISTSGADYNFQFIELCEPKYEAIRVIFKNKYGALQDIWMTKKSSRTLNTTRDSYKINTLDYSSLTYSTNDHQNISFNVQGTEMITLNSPIYPEWMNDHFQELFLSDQIWLEDSNLDVFPVTIKSQQFAKKTGVNDKMIQYTIDFEFAHDIIQNVR